MGGSTEDGSQKSEEGQTMTGIEVAAALFGAVVLKGSAVALGAWLLSKTGMGFRVYGIGAAALMLIALSALEPLDGSGFITISHRTVESVSIGPVSVSLPGVFLAVWATGVLVMLTKLVIDIRAARGLARSGVQAGRRAVVQLRRAGEAIGVTSLPEVRETTALATAALVGFCRPVLLIPVQAQEWSDEELFGVLCHELEHVRRTDWLLMMVERMASAIFWINPLVHLMIRQAGAAREMAADEAALRAGTPALVYAGRLIAVARQLHQSPKLAVSVAFASGSVEQRVKALFDGRDRRGTTPVSVLGTLVVVAPLVLVIAAFQPFSCLP